jgi:hypothetical protein
MPIWITSLRVPTKITLRTTDLTPIASFHRRVRMFYLTGVEVEEAVHQEVKVQARIITLILVKSQRSTYRSLNSPKNQTTLNTQAETWINNISSSKIITFTIHLLGHRRMSKLLLEEELLLTSNPSKVETAFNNSSLQLALNPIRNCLVEVVREAR